MSFVHLHGENPWKLAFLLLVLAFFFCMGVAHAIAPQYFLRRSGLRKGGEMLTEFNLMGIQFVGLLAAIFAAGSCYDVVKDLLSK